MAPTRRRAFTDGGACLGAGSSLDLLSLPTGALPHPRVSFPPSLFHLPPCHLLPVLKLDGFAYGSGERSALRMDEVALLAFFFLGGGVCVVGVGGGGGLARGDGHGA